jgi:hypothetical protein
MADNRSSYLIVIVTQQLWWQDFENVLYYLLRTVKLQYKQNKLKLQKEDSKYTEKYSNTYDLGADCTHATWRILRSSKRATKSIATQDKRLRGRNNRLFAKCNNKPKLNLAESHWKHSSHMLLECRNRTPMIEVNGTCIYNHRVTTSFFYLTTNQNLDSNIFV